MRNFYFTSIMLGFIALLGGCNNFAIKSAPKSDLVFDRFETTRLGRSTANDVLAYIQNEQLDEFINQDEQTIVSWGQKRDGAVIWLNAVNFDPTNNLASRKYAIKVFEDSQDWTSLSLAKAEKFRADFEFILPPEFDEIEITTENDRLREALKAAVYLYIRDINVVRYESDFIYTTGMMVRQTFNALLYELERVPAKLSIIDQRDGVEFSHPTMGDGKARMLIGEDKYTVRIKVKIGGQLSSFAKHTDVLAMDTPEFAQKLAITKQAPKSDQQASSDESKGGLFGLFGSKKADTESQAAATAPSTGTQKRTPEELQEIEEMARQRAAEDVAKIRAQIDQSIVEGEEQPEAEQSEAEPQEQSEEAPTEAEPQSDQAQEQQPESEEDKKQTDLPQED